MRTERRLHRAPILLGLLLAALLLARPATAQGIGLEELREMMAWGTSSLVLLDQLEYAPQTDGAPVTLDAVGWYGGAYDRLWFRVEGEQLTTAWAGEVEAQLFYGRLGSAADLARAEGEEAAETLFVVGVRLWR